MLSDDAYAILRVRQCPGWIASRISIGESRSSGGENRNYEKSYRVDLPIARRPGDFRSRQSLLLCISDERQSIVLCRAHGRSSRDLDSVEKEPVPV